MKLVKKKKHQGHKAALLPLCVLLFVLIQVGCGTLELNSHWRENAVIIDGKTSDWLGILTYIEDPNISVGIMNDENYLYICLIAEDIFLRSQVIRRGFYLWFDPEGGKQKSFGIKFPLGMMEIRPQGEGAEVPEGRQKPRQEFDPSFLENLDITFEELEILGPDKEILERIKLEDIKGIEAQVKSGSGLLTYEIKISLKASPEFSYAIGTQPGEIIGIGFEIPKLDRANMRAPGGMGDRGGMGGRGGMSGGMGGRGSRSGMGGMQPRFEGLNIWVSTALATENNKEAK